jgi:hypothetical protein
MDWNFFSKVEKEKVTVEQILPQTQNRVVLANQFRQYSADEIKNPVRIAGKSAPTCAEH